MVRWLARGLSGRGHRVEVATRTGSGVIAGDAVAAPTLEGR